MQSIGNKFPEFTTLVDHYHQKSIGITESWCSEDIQDAEIKLNNHSIHRGDKQSGKGGGVILYMLNSLRSLPCSALNSLEINDSVWCTITLSNNDLLLAELIYRSPNSSFSNTDKLIQTLSNLQQLQRHTHLLLMGTLTFPTLIGETTLLMLLIIPCLPSFILLHKMFT